MRLLKIAISASAIALLSACANMGQQVVKLSQDFDEQATNFQMRGGNNTAKGSALIRQRNGGVVSCAGYTVHLMAATPYQRERMQAIYGSTDRGFNPAFGGRNVKFENEPYNYRHHMKQTVCDAQGMFKFEGLADGSYYVVSNITWQVDTYTTNGGVLFALFELSGGKVTERTLSP